MTYLDVFEDYATPVPAAQSLFHSCSKKRKGILPKTMQFIMHVSTHNSCMHVANVVVSVV